MTPTRHDEIRLPTGLYIGGQWFTSGSAGASDHINPTTGKAQQSFPLAGRAEIDAAVAAAGAARYPWSDDSTERRDALVRLGELIRREADEFTWIYAAETGTPVQQQRPRMADIAARFDYYAGWIDKLTGDTIPISPGRVVDYTLLEPVGVVAKVLTWNTPMGGIGISVAAALAAGCTVVIKPSEVAPFAAVRFAELCVEAGIADGVVNVVTGGPEAGEALVSHRDVDKISFTGGLSIATRIQKAAADPLTPLLFELGGKSASIVFADANLDQVAAFSRAITAINGQGCSLPTRFLVEDAIYDEVVERVIGALKTVRVGDPLDPETEMGPVISEAASDRILSLVERAVTDGARLLLGGTRLDGKFADGYFLPPIVLGEVDPDSEIAQQELFGPVLSVLRFRGEDHAVALANATRYGLAAYVHTRDIGRALRLASSLDSGNVGINGAMAPASYAAPFGGVKDSGFGREGGREGIMEFLRVKNVAIAIN